MIYDDIKRVIHGFCCCFELFKRYYFQKNNGAETPKIIKLNVYIKIFRILGILRRFLKSVSKEEKGPKYFHTYTRLRVSSNLFFTAPIHNIHHIRIH